ncbi:MAG: HEPN domain-containing protein [Eubacteriales bacterium]|nr:HEPN domain-containing protein [Eubacteriales bacterium]
MVQHNEGTREDLVKYRIETAKGDLKSAKLLLAANEFRGANNRAYYSIYHVISAVHALDGRAYKRHKDALANFNKDYIRTEIFPRPFGRRIAEAEEIRHASDYDDFYLATKSEAEEVIATAEELIDMIEEYCIGRMEQDSERNRE